VRRRVSGAAPILKEEEVKEVTVRQVPFTEMESPREQSVRMEAQLEIVIVVPPPEVASWGRSSETAVKEVLVVWVSRRKGWREEGRILPRVSTMPVNMMGDV
jgi:hypothetical protein